MPDRFSHRFSICLLAVVALGSVFASVAAANTIVEMDFNGGLIDSEGNLINYIQLELYDDLAPVTVNNFLQYVNHHDYDGTFIHRSVSGFVIQGGGYMPVVGSSGFIDSFDPISTYGSIINEFSAGRSNLRGTIAMAKLGGDPNSATSQWFINLGDNSANLDFQNGGFTVFGRVLGSGMTLADAIASLPPSNLNPGYDPNYAAEVAADPINGPQAGPFAAVPLFNNDTTLVTVTSVQVVPEPSSIVLLLATGVGGCFLIRRKTAIAVKTLRQE